MAGDIALASTETADHPEPTRRDFLYIATGAVGVVGAALIAWPLIDQMNPDAAALALAQVDVDISAVKPGESLIVKWRGKPVVVRQRTDKEIDSAKAVNVSELRDQLARNANLPDSAPATDANRSALASFTTADPDRAWTVGELARFIAIGGRGPVVVGSGATVAAELERWVCEADVDGFNLAYAVTPGTFVDFVEHVVRELRRRGRARDSYPAGTLRENLGAAPGPLLASDHPGARYLR